MRSANLIVPEREKYIEFIVHLSPILSTKN